MKARRAYGSETTDHSTRVSKLVPSRMAFNARVPLMTTHRARFARDRRGGFSPALGHWYRKGVQAT